MNIKELILEIRGRVVSLSKIDTKESVKGKLGDPDDVGGFFGKRKTPLIYKYDEIEFHFDTDSSLFMIFQDQKLEGQEGGIVTLCLDFRKTY
ncbi:hypothetical protein [Hahella sp. CCB-MM4]|uniref:hypothetical protein n=1 Tax=Hahella sp. (strain CCB-MM4) TaxID=1926491 RepID=UPI000B9A7710|nr:hypothetical protein [Hahella sp. CCB-MM4]